MIPVLQVGFVHEHRSKETLANSFRGNRWDEREGSFGGRQRVTHSIGILVVANRGELQRL
jgi:hypothetical protein